VEETDGTRNFAVVAWRADPGDHLAVAVHGPLTGNAQAKIGLRRYSVRPDFLIGARLRGTRFFADIPI
jgi:hypothetical protein